MVALSLQTLLLLGAAYLIGAAVACLIRRTISAPATRVPAERRVDPLPEAAQREATVRFGRALEGDASPAPQPTAAVAAPVPASAPVAAAVAGSAQDLKRIRLIDAHTEAALNKLGVHRYEQIAAWKQPDLQRIGPALGLKRRISQENWIEQAQVLAKGEETNYSKRRARGEAASAAPTPDEGEQRPVPPAAAKPQVTMSPRPATAGAAGVAAEVATATVVAAASAAAPPSPPPLVVSPANVSERAAFAQRRTEAPAPAPAQAAPAPAAAATPAAPKPAAPPPPAVTAGATSEPAVPVRPGAPTARDNLQRIGSITADTEKLLNAQGVSRYSQIAHWSPADVERFDKQLATPGRIARENWVEQAQILSRGGDTAFSRDYDRVEHGGSPPAPPLPTKLADAIRENEGRRISRTDLGTLRSVRSEAYQNPEPGPEAAQRAAAQNKVLRSSALNDLKRIRGIGVLIEKKLNSMGVATYEQIANWSAEDIDRVSQSLDFKGRIERENWVEQARILASGGATEFSRRVDRGDVETSRLKT